MADAAAAGRSNPAIGKAFGVSSRQVARIESVQGARAVRWAIEDTICLVLHTYFGAAPELIEKFMRTRIPSFPSKGRIRVTIDGLANEGREWKPRSEYRYPGLLVQVLRTRLDVLDFPVREALTLDQAKGLLTYLVVELALGDQSFAA